MSDAARITYNKMLERFRETGERFIKIQVPFELRDSRREIVSELEYEGLISDADIHGQQGIACTLTDNHLCNINIQ